MSIYFFFHYSFFFGLFLAFTYNKKEPPAFGAAPAFFCILLSFLGFSFRQIPIHLGNQNVLDVNAPFFYKISGIWSNHEGSLFSWCRTLTFFFGLLLCHRSRYSIKRSTPVSKRRAHREILFSSFFSNFVNHSIVSLPRYEKKSGVAPHTPFVLRTLLHSELCSRRYESVSERSERRNRTPPHARKKKGKKTHPLLHLARDDKERASSIDEKQIDGVLGIALFSSLFFSASSDPFVRNLFINSQPIASFNPVLQDPLSAIHPPCIFAGEVGSAMGFGLCRSKMMNRIVTLNTPPILKDAAGRLLFSAGCRELLTIKFKDVGEKCYPALLLRSNRSPLMLLRRRRRFFAFSSLWTGALVDTGREQPKRVVHNGKKDTTTLPLCWTAGTNTVISHQDPEPIRIWILTCWCFLTVGILPGSWWAHHELGRGGWWFWDPVENASFMPRILATACIHSVIFPLLYSWTSSLNIVTFPCCVSGTFSIRSGLVASVHNFATDETRGILLWRYFLIMTGISILLFYQICRIYKKELVVGQSTLVHLRN